MSRFLIAVALAVGAFPAGAQRAGGIDVSQQPLFTISAEPPLNMLVMGRDHKLYYEAYNDASDLDGDRVIDVGYKPEQIDYFGYFDSHRCYGYAGDRFVASGTTASKRCPGTWSGDFLNYVTTSRMDAIRKVLYGGYRAVDTGNETVLERAYIPQDAHTWAKQYVSPDVDGYDIADYTPLTRPASGRRHLFANVTIRNDEAWGPRLRVLTDSVYPPWQWVSIERPVAGDRCVEGWNGPRCDSPNGAKLTDYKVRVRVCDAGDPEAFCKRYPNGKYKPVGLLHDYGESGQMMFGLLTGSYAKNTEGGTLRANMARFDREVNTENGMFRNDVKDGIVYTIDHLRTIDFNAGDFVYRCGWITTRPVNDGECSMWGNPVAEMMYETLRYFGGATKPRPEFDTPSGASDGNAPLSLAKPEWKPPYVVSPRGGGFPQCAAPVMTVISDINPSYDFSLPGSTWRSLGGGSDPDSLSGLNVSAEVDAIWSADGGGSRRAFIGESGGVFDSAPTPKTVSNLSTVRGLSPEEPTKQGTYYSAGIARFGATHAIGGNKPVRTYVVALASPLPRIDFPVGAGRISLVPFAKSVGGGGIDAAAAFQPTNQIVDFYVQRIANTDPDGSDLNVSINGGRPYAEFRINFEDVEQGADHDMDVIVLYTLRATEDGQLDVKLASEYSFGGMFQHAGYVVSGSSQDGVYLEVCDLRDNGTNDGTRTSCQAQTRYRLNSPPNRPAGWCAENLSSPECAGLPPTATRRFSPGSAGGAVLLNGPLWYAAKYGLPGGMADGDSNGQPDNYFLVTNALGLKEQLRRAFDTIVADTRPSASVATSTARFIPGATLGYQVSFKSDDWTGDVQAFRLRNDGTMGAQVWSANAKLPAAESRAIFSARLRSGGDGFDGVAFTRAALGDDATTVFAGLDPARYDVEGLFAFLRGAQDQEQPLGPYRKRSSRIGDVLNSTPAVTAKISYGYGQLPPTIGGMDSGSASYRAFVESKAASPVLYVGANDGMLHAFDGGDGSGGGRELFAYVPNAVLGKLNDLARPGYVHAYYVDGTPTVGDAYVRRGWRTVLLESAGAGARSVFALDVTRPRNFGATDVMWEFNDRIDRDMGQFVGQASMGLAPDGRWIAAFGNGYNSKNHHAILFVRSLEDGGAIAKIDTGVGSPESPNGLSTATLVDNDGDGSADTIYAGDYRGNLWKFEYDRRGWRIALGGQPLFTAADADGHRQSITSGVYTVENPLGGTMVMFGTGRYLGTADADANRLEADGKPLVDSIYAIWDKGDGTRIEVTGGARDDALQRQSITGYSNGYRQSTRNPVNFRTSDDPAGKMGWYLDLSWRVREQDALRGERVIASPTVILGTLLVGTFRPLGNTCEPGGLNAIMELDALTGAASYTEVPPPGGFNGGGPPAGTGGTDIGNGPPQGSPNPIVYAPPPPIIPEIGCQPGEPGCGELPPVSEAGECRWTLPNPANKPVQAPMPCGRIAWRQLR